MNTRTNVVLDDQLVAKAMARAGVRTKRAALEAALRAFVREPDYTGLLALAGSGVIADDYDPKALFTQPIEHPLHHVSESPPLLPGRRAQPSGKDSARTVRQRAK